MVAMKKTGYIGLEIKNNIVRFVELQSVKPIVVKKYGEKSVSASLIKNGKIKSQSAIKDVLSQLFTEFKVTDNGMVYAAFNQDLLIRSVELPQTMSESDIKKFLFLEVGDGIQVPFEQPVSDLIATSSSSKKKRKRGKKEGDQQTVYFVATASESLNIVAKTLKKTKQFAAAVDISALAYHRAIEEKHKNLSKNSYLLLELDCGIANFTIFNDGIPVYSQFEEYNPGHWSPAPTNSEEVDWLFNRDVKEIDWENLSLEDDRIKWLYDEEVEKSALNKLSETIDSVLYYYSSAIAPNQELKKMIVVGDNPLMSTIVKKTFNERLNISFETIQSLGKDNKGHKVPSRFNLALGLAMKEVKL